MIMGCYLFCIQFQYRLCGHLQVSSKQHDPALRFVQTASLKIKIEHKVIEKIKYHRERTSLVTAINLLVQRRKVSYVDLHIISLLFRVYCVVVPPRSHRIYNIIHISQNLHIFNPWQTESFHPFRQDCRLAMVSNLVPTKQLWQYHPKFQYFLET